MLFLCFAKVMKEGGYPMGKSKLLKNGKNGVFSLFLLLVFILFLALIIPAIGVSATSPSAWISIVNFFEAIKIHFAQYWMFYSFAGVVIFAYFGRSKK